MSSGSINTSSDARPLVLNEYKGFYGFDRGIYTVIDPTIKTIAHSQENALTYYDLIPYYNWINGVVFKSLPFIAPRNGFLRITGSNNRDYTKTNIVINDDTLEKVVYSVTIFNQNSSLNTSVGWIPVFKDHQYSNIGTDTGNLAFFSCTYLPMCG